jgi:hypothetical protein
VAQAAENHAEVIREEAREEAREIRAGANEYAFEVLCDLEQELKRALTVVENGIRAVEARQHKQHSPEQVPNTPQS